MDAHGLRRFCATAIEGDPAGSEFRTIGRHEPFRWNPDRRARFVLQACPTMEVDLPRAAIFDLDGTLLDSVDLDAIAWHEAMLKFGHNVSFEQARSQIGKGGDKLIPCFCPRRPSGTMVRSLTLGGAYISKAGICP